MLLASTFVDACVRAATKSALATTGWLLPVTAVLTTQAYCAWGFSGWPARGMTARTFGMRVSTFAFSSIGTSEPSARSMRKTESLAAGATRGDAGSELTSIEPVKKKKQPVVTPKPSITSRPRSTVGV